MMSSFDTIAYSFCTGFIPWFLRRKLPVLELSSDVSPMIYFSHADEDGTNIVWGRHINSRNALEEAITGNVYESDTLHSRHA